MITGFWLHHTEKIMENNKTNTGYIEDEIDLRELIILFWKNKITIISIMLIAAILTALYSIFLIKPIYHARMNILINAPTTYKAKYGDYVLLMNTGQQYINLITNDVVLEKTLKDIGENTTVEDLKSKITIPVGEINAKTYNNQIKIASTIPEETKKIADALYKNYIVYVDAVVIEEAVNYYNNDNTVKISQLEQELKKLKEDLSYYEVLLTETPQIRDQKAIKKGLEGISNIAILGDIINPQYTRLQNDIIIKKQEINSRENAIKVYNTNLKELSTVKGIIENYYDTGELADMGRNFQRISDTSISLLSSPDVPKQKSSPNNTRNIIFGTVLGGILSIFIVFVKEYWFKKA